MTPKIQTHEHWLSSLVTGKSIKRGGVDFASFNDLILFENYVSRFLFFLVQIKRQSTSQIETLFTVWSHLTHKHMTLTHKHMTANTQTHDS
jgi:hypothetical protein